MNLGEVGTGCPNCGAAPHEGPCRPALDRIFHDLPLGTAGPPSAYARMGKIERCLFWSFCIAIGAILLVVIAESSAREKRQWRADWLRRTELCEAQGGIPRYEVRGRGYDGCDFPPLR